MAPRDILDTLLSSTHHSLAAILVDEGGETVAWASERIAEDELRLAGAYVGLRLRGASRALATDGPERVERVRLERESLTLSAERLQNDWCIVLVQERPAYPALVRGQLQIAATACERLLGAESHDE